MRKRRTGGLYTLGTLIVGTIALVASIQQVAAAPREEMAIFTFGPNAAGYVETPEYYSPQLLAQPVLTMIGGTKDADGKDGEPFGPDAKGVSHAPGQAAVWTDVAISGTDAEWTVQLDTRTWKSFQVRFDYRCESTTAGSVINSLDIAYRTSPTGSWTVLANNAALTPDDDFHTFTRDFTANTGLDNKPFVELRFYNLAEADTGNDPNGGFYFDNFEITALPAAPATLAGLTAVADNAPQVVLNWTAPAVAVDGFVVRRQDGGSGAYNLIATINNPGATSYTDTNVTDYVSYAYRVSAFNVDVEGTFDSATDRTPPAPPVIVSCARNANQTVTVDWNAATGASNYRVRRSNNPNGPYTQIAQTASSTTIYTDSPGAGTFYYLVVATNTTYGVSRNSTAANTCGAAAPDGLAPSVLNTPQVTLTWNSVSGASTYTVWRSTSPGWISGGNYTQVGSPTASLSFTDTAPSVADNTTYYYVVSASVGSCNSSISSEVRAALPPGPPTGVSATPAGGKVTISWTAASGATSYNVRRSPTSGGPYATVQTTSGTSVTDITGGGAFYYVVTAVNSLGGESRNSTQVSAINSFLVLNEIKANPPGSASDNPARPDSKWEYIELKGTPGYNLANHRVVVLNGRQQGVIGRGVATLVVPLSGTVPASGIVFIRQDGGHAAPPPPAALEIPVLAAHRIAVGPTTNPDDELIVNDASTIILASGGTAPGVGTPDYDAGDNGELDSSWSTLGQTIIDTVAWKTGDNDDFVYDGATRLKQTDGVPSAATRIRENTTANSPIAWWFGDIIGSSSTLAYETSDPDNLSGSEPGEGAAFNYGAFLTPGAPNEPNTQAFLAANLPPVTPKGIYVLPTGLNTFWQWPNVLLSDTLNPTPAPSTVSVYFYNSPVVFDNAANIAAFFEIGYWWLKLKADHIAANRLVTLVPDNDWSRARSLAFSALEVHPDSIRTTGFPTYGISSTTVFHEGISGASTAMRFYTPYEGARYAVIGDDDQNRIGLASYFSVGGVGNYFPNLSTDLGVTGEIDIEGSTFKPVPDLYNGEIGIGGVGYWTGSMANGPAPGAAVRPDPDRVFAATITYASLGEYTMSVRGYSKKVRTALSNDSQYITTYRLNESMRAAEDSKAPWGFNVEAMELAPNGTTMYLGLRAPLVPAPASNLSIRDPSRGTLALVVPLNNVDQITDAMNDTGTPTFGAPITLNLGGRGIRTMTKSGSTYYIVAGPPTNSIYRPGDFAIFTWDGVAGHAAVELAADLAGRNPEAIADVRDPFWLSSEPTLRLVEDNGTTDWYGEGAENKDFPLPLWSNLQKSRQFEVRLGMTKFPEFYLDAPGQPYSTGGAAGFGIHKLQDPTYDYWIAGGGGNGGNNYRAVGIPWDNGPGDPSLILATLSTSGDTNDVAFDVAGGLAVGVTRNANLTQEWPVSWGLASGAIQKLLAGGSFGQGRGISPVKDPVLDAYIAVGVYYSSGTHAFYNTATGPQTRTELPGVGGATYTVANAINENFTVVGASGSPTQFGACAWVQINDVYQLVQLPNLTGIQTDSSEALGINANGTIVGYCYSNNVKRACLWAHVDSRWAAYALPSLDPTRHSEARDISTRGEVVGNSLTSGNVQHGCIWINGTLGDLNDLIGTFGPTLPPGQQNVTIRSANAINEVGWITGDLSCQDPFCFASRAYLMRP